MAVELILTGVTQRYGGPGTFDSPDAIAGDTGVLFGWIGDGRGDLEDALSANPPEWDGTVMTKAFKTLTEDPNGGNCGIWYINLPTVGVTSIEVWPETYPAKYRAYRMRNCNKVGPTIGDTEGGLIYGGGDASFSLELEERDLVLTCYGSDGSSDFVGEGTEILDTTTPDYIAAATCNSVQAGNGIANISWDWGGYRDGCKAGATFLTDPSASNRMIIAMSKIQEKMGLSDLGGFKVKDGLFQQEPELVTI